MAARRAPLPGAGARHREPTFCLLLVLYYYIILTLLPLHPPSQAQARAIENRVFLVHANVAADLTQREMGSHGNRLVRTIIPANPQC